MMRPSEVNDIQRWVTSNAHKLPASASQAIWKLIDEVRRLDGLLKREREKASKPIE